MTNERPIVTGRRRAWSLGVLLALTIVPVALSAIIVSASGAAMGKPVVTTDVTGCRDSVVDGVTGRVVSKGNVDGAAAALVELARAPAMRRVWGEAARAMVAERFTLESAVQRYIDLLSDEIRQGQASA